MFTNTHKRIAEFQNNFLSPLTKVDIGLIPKNFHIEGQRLMTCKYIDGRTKIISLTMNGEWHDVGDEFMGVFGNSNFCNDHAMLVNSEGDIVYYNLFSKSTHCLQKQHPNNVVDLEVLQNGSHFMTVGGSIKGDEGVQRIVKVWTGQENLQLKGRVKTGHKKQIDCSFLLNKNRIVTCSDRNVRVINLCWEGVESVRSMQFQVTAGCQIDNHCSLFGGRSNNLTLLDSRNRRTLTYPSCLSYGMLQVSRMERIAEGKVMLADVNKLLICDLRKFQLKQVGKSQGERVSEIVVMNQSLLAIGNFDKSLQFWKIGQSEI